MAQKYLDSSNEWYPQLEQAKAQIDKAYEGYRKLNKDWFFLHSQILQVENQAGYVD